MSNSILTSTKKLLGIVEEYTAFDTDILMHINTYFSVLHTVGAAPVEGFFITGAAETWEDFIEGRQNIEMVKSYIYLRVKLIFDPPATANSVNSMTKVADALEWRLNTLELVFNPLAYGAVPVVEEV